MSVLTDKEYPKYVVNGVAHDDAQKAAQAFLGLTAKKSYTGAAVVQTEPGKAIPLGSIRDDGQKYLHINSFLNDPMVKAFRESYSQLHAAQEKKAQTTPTFPRFKVGRDVYHSADAATQAFLKLKTDHSSTGAVVVETDERRAFEVAGINAGGERYLNKLYFQDHAFMRGFQDAYSKATGIELSSPSPAPKKNIQYPRFKMANVAYENAEAVAKAYHEVRSPNAWNSFVVVETEPGKAFQVAGALANGERFLNKDTFQNHEMMKDFKEAYSDCIQNASKIDYDALNEISPLQTKVDPGFLKSLTQDKKADTTLSLDR